MDDVVMNITNLYTKSGYLSRFGNDLWNTILLLILFFLALSYSLILNRFKTIKANWTYYRCHPSVIPFAGMINKGPGETSIEFTSKNFTYCTQTILRTIIGEAFTPFYYMMNVVTATFVQLSSSLVEIRGQFNKVRNATSILTQHIMGRVLNITTPIVKLIIAVKSMIGKLIGTVTASIYMLLGSYMSMKSLMIIIFDFIVKILYILVGVIVGLWATAWIFPANIPLAIVNTGIMSAIMIPLVIIKVFMGDIMKLSTPGLPGIPKKGKKRCFDKNTVIEMEGGRKKISDISIGDILHDGSKVTSTMKLATSNMPVYILNDVVVTGNHEVFFENFGWIPVENHPNAELVEDYNEPIVHCINTNTKVIKIGVHTFSDWDDIDDVDLEQLLKNAPLPTNFTTGDVKLLETGFDGNTLLRLNDGSSKLMKDICVGDFIGNEEVYGTVVSEANDMYRFNINNEIILCTKTVRFEDSDNSTVLFKIIDSQQKEKMYNLLTVGGFFSVANLRVADYNNGIEQYLS